MSESSQVPIRSRAGRGVLLTTVVGSGMAFLDSTVVNVALPALGRAFGAGLDGLQWTLDAYLLTLTALLLLGGSLGDRLGRRRVYLAGVASFAIASVGCGLAPTLPLLVAARALQGVAGALLVPTSLALIRACIRDEDQGTAIGLWTGLSGVTSALGPLLGGWLVQAVSWRAIFFINVPVAALAFTVGMRSLPKEQRSVAAPPLDLRGGFFAVTGLGGLVLALIEGPVHGWSGFIWLGVAAGVLLLGLFLFTERRRAAPMLPLGLFRSRAFTGANLVTLAVYAALAVVTFLLMLELQSGWGLSPLQAGLTMLPLTLLMLTLSPVAGRFAQRHGARALMTLGPLFAARGLLFFAQLRPGHRLYVPLFAGVVALGVGLVLTVAPLTATVLRSVAPSEAGIASGVNNAVARLAGLLGVAVIPGLAGLARPGQLGGAALVAGVGRAMLISAALCVAGAVVAWFVVPGRGKGARGAAA